MENYSYKSFELMRNISKKMMYKANENIQELGLTAQQGKLLKFLYANQDEELIQKDIAKRFNKTTASIGSMLKTLEREGYIERYIPKENTRLKRVNVLKKGIDIIEEFDKKDNSINLLLDDLITEKEYQQLYLTLKKIEKRL